MTCEICSCGFCSAEFCWADIEASEDFKDKIFEEVKQLREFKKKVNVLLADIDKLGKYQLYKLSGVQIQTPPKLANCPPDVAEYLINWAYDIKSLDGAKG